MSAAAKYAPVPGKIPGKLVNLGGRELILAPLNLDGVQAFEPLQAKVKERAGGGFREFRDLVAEALHLSLARNYPDMTVEDVAELLDVRNVITALDDLAEVSGYRRVAPGEPTPASP